MIFAIVIFVLLAFLLAYFVFRQWRKPVEKNKSSEGATELENPKADGERGAVRVLSRRYTLKRRVVVLGNQDEVSRLLTKFKHSYLDSRGVVCAGREGNFVFTSVQHLATGVRPDAVLILWDTTDPTSVQQEIVDTASNILFARTCPVYLLSQNVPFGTTEGSPKYVIRLLDSLRRATLIDCIRDQGDTNTTEQAMVTSKLMQSLEPIAARLPELRRIVLTGEPINPKVLVTHLARTGPAIQHAILVLFASLVGIFAGSQYGEITELSTFMHSQAFPLRAHLEQLSKLENQGTEAHVVGMKLDAIQAVTDVAPPGARIRLTDLYSRTEKSELMPVLRALTVERSKQQAPTSDPKSLLNYFEEHLHDTRLIKHVEVMDPGTLASLGTPQDVCSDPHGVARARLRVGLESAGRSISLGEFGGPDFDDVFYYAGSDEGSVIPAPFTRQAYRRARSDIPRIARALFEEIRDQCGGKSPSFKEISMRIRRDYETNYMASWRDAMSDIRLQPPESVDDVPRILYSLAEPSSPLFHAIDLMLANTWELVSPLEQGVIAKVNSLLSKSGMTGKSRQSPLPVAATRGIAAFHRLNNGTRKSEKKLHKLAMDLERILENTPTEKLIAQETTAKGSALKKKLHQFAVRLNNKRDPLGFLLTNLYSETRSLIMRIAREELNSEINELATFCHQRLGNSFPIRLDARSDATEADLQRYFEDTDTIIERFQPFLSLAGTVRSEFEANSAVIRQLQTNSTLHELLFAGSNTIQPIPLSWRVVEQTPRSLFSVTFAERTLEYFGGKTNVFHTEIAFDGKPFGYRLDTVEENGEVTKIDDAVFSGKYALLRMILSDSVETRQKGESVAVTFSGRGGSAAKAVVQLDGQGAELLKLLSSFSCPTPL